MSSSSVFSKTNLFIIVFIIVGMIIAVCPSAHAIIEIVGDTQFQTQANAVLNDAHDASQDRDCNGASGTARMIDQIGGDSHVIKILLSNSTTDNFTNVDSLFDAADPLKGTNSYIYWNPSLRGNFVGAKVVERDPRSSLVHELRHSLDAAKGLFVLEPSFDPIVAVQYGFGVGVRVTDVDEEPAVAIENNYRRSLKLPQREDYSDLHFDPSSIFPPCQPCGNGQRACEGLCVSVYGDHCKATCSSSSPQCCGGSCVSLASNPNCGACGVSCSGNKSCCASSCVDLTADPENCGFCGNVCGSGQVCTPAGCVCPAGQVLINGICSSCPSGESACVSSCCPTGQCNNGQCGNSSCGVQTCGASQICCGGTCVNVNLATDVNNCGACFNKCIPAYPEEVTWCEGGVCKVNVCCICNSPDPSGGCLIAPYGVEVPWGTHTCDVCGACPAWGPGNCSALSHTAPDPMKDVRF